MITGFPMGQAQVSAAQVKIESVGVNALDRRRVDVAVDLTPCRESLTVELVIVGPSGDEMCSSLLINNRDWQLDKVLHLRRDAEPGVHTLHVGLFLDKELLDRAARRFSFPGAP